MGGSVPRTELRLFWNNGQDSSDEDADGNESENGRFSALSNAGGSSEDDDDFFHGNGTSKDPQRLRSPRDDLIPTPSSNCLQRNSQRRPAHTQEHHNSLNASRGPHKDLRPTLRSS